ncbi:cytidine deaminase [Flavobacterium salilacus subsp. salilacus]|uniref:cytidine deaminase n=1 Tax=Flavobacterium TaxID=237 RepID=UPI001075709A|nr:MULTISPECIES: cytidine deaminase [Flavobacterium]KAF2519622.1 cytidine deaminase [Flavobacterium salilacus subsp. salilacus]MBE1614476.1 cytidine deaminase [Flavobacterium sp. SaA2.13]
MENISIISTFTAFNSVNELPEDVKMLMQQAVEIRKKSYAPYSKFHVGAALLLDNGEIVLGSNQENAAYPSGLCAERVAVFYAGATYPEANILKIAISAASEEKKVEEPIPPCGACRQSIAEYEMKQDIPIEIYFMGEAGKVYKSDSLKNLLPLVFENKYL